MAGSEGAVSVVFGLGDIGSSVRLKVDLLGEAAAGLWLAAGGEAAGGGLTGGAAPRGWSTVKRVSSCRISSGEQDRRRSIPAL